MKREQHGGDIYRHPGVLDFSTNLNPLGTPPCVTEAVRESAARVAAYPDTEAAGLIAALAGAEGVDAGCLILGNGAAELIYAVAQSLPTGRALLVTPTFSEYGRALEGAGWQVVTHPLRRENGFRPDEGILDAITEDADLLFLCQPNNPTGILIEPDLLSAIRDRCKRTGTFLVLDECFLDFADGGTARSLAGEAARSEDLFVLKAFTKRFAMPGLRLGYGICGNAGLLGAMRAKMQPWNISVPAQMAGEAALEQAADWAARAVGLIKKERAFLEEKLAEAGFKVCHSSANYIFFSGRPGLAEEMLKENILIRDCSNYEGLEEGDYRVAVRLHEQNEEFAAALARIAGTNKGEGV